MHAEGHLYRAAMAGRTVRDVAIGYPWDLTAQMLDYAEATRKTREQFRPSAARGPQGD